jgi:hypothetical protein
MKKMHRLLRLRQVLHHHWHEGMPVLTRSALSGSGLISLLGRGMCFRSGPCWPCKCDDMCGTSILMFQKKDIILLRSEPGEGTPARVILDCTI